MGLGFSTVAGASAVVKNAYNQLKSNQALKGQQVTQLKDAAAQIVTEVLKQNPNHVQAQTLKVQLNSGKSLSVSDLLTLQTLAEESTTAVAQPTSAENSTMNSPRVVTENRAFTNGNAINKNTAINQADVTKSLRNKGINSQKADSIAEAITARLNGQELTRPQRDILRSALESPTVQSVVSEFMQKKTDGVDSVQKDVYDKENISGGYSIGEAASNKSRNTLPDGILENNTAETENIITDGSHLENGKLKPNVTYKTGEHDYFYTTNEDGLIVNVRTDDLQEKTHKDRLSHNPNTYGKKPGDHAGHLIADRFGGSPELDNLVSQAKEVNWGEYRKMEDQWANALKNGQKVKVNIDIHYDQGGVRPISFDLSYTIDGVSYNRKISNQSGGSK